MPLQKGSQSYDVIIGEDLQKKIDYLCAQMPTVEWSGTLFYKIEGDFNNEDKLKVRAFDLYLQDIGSSTYTAFNISPDLISYMCDQPELLEDDVFMGLIHSHNNMSTFFSGTDTSTLQKEGTEKDNFVSLIVNNHRKYTAGITSKCTQKRTIKQISFYKTFFNKIVEKEEEIDVESEIIEWYDLKVYMPENNHFDILDKCITDIKQTKEKAKTIVNNKQTNSISPRTPILAGTKIIPPTFNSAYDFDLNSKWEEAPTLPFKEWENDDKNTKQVKVGTEVDVELDEYYSAIEVDAEIVEGIVRQLLSGSILTAHHDKMDLDKFAETSNLLFDRRFENNKEFKNWAEYHIDFLLSQKFTDDSEIDLMGAYAYATINRLAELPNNKYINLFIECLEGYI